MIAPDAIAVGMRLRPSWSWVPHDSLIVTAVGRRFFLAADESGMEREDAWPLDPLSEGQEGGYELLGTPKGHAARRVAPGQHVIIDPKGHEIGSVTFLQRQPAEARIVRGVCVQLDASDLERAS